MKSIALFLFVVIAQLGVQLTKADPINPAVFFPQEDACIAELQLDKSKVLEENENEIAPETDPTFKTFLSCYWKKMKWMELNGTLNLENLKQSVTNAALADVDDADLSSKIMIKLMVQHAFKKCQTFVRPIFETPEDAIAVKVQNCIVQTLNGIIDS